jgi:hypothetical protein
VYSFLYSAAAICSHSFNCCSFSRHTFTSTAFSLPHCQHKNTMQIQTQQFVYAQGRNCRVTKYNIHKTHGA